ncbi:MAG TPA: ABC transporter permease, partial [Sphingomicrobium sp.]
NIVDYLMPPLSTGELIAGLVGAAVTRAVLVGFAVWLAMLVFPEVSVEVRRPELVLWFGLMGALLLSFLGLLTSVWADKFDHAAAVTNFVVTPLALLSGTFYSVHQLTPSFQAVSHANPIFYVISGFRAGFLGVSDSPLLVGGVALLLLNVVLWIVCYAVLKSGWRIKA